MNEQSKKLAKEIADQHPNIIIITGSTDPTYSSDTFFEALIMSQDEFRINSRKLNINLNGFVIKTSDSIEDWIMSIVNRIHPDYEISKHTQDDVIAYVVGEYYHDEPPEFYEDSKTFSIDFGGVILLHYKYI